MDKPNAISVIVETSSTKNEEDSQQNEPEYFADNSAKTAIVDEIPDSPKIETVQVDSMDNEYTIEYVTVEEVSQTDEVIEHQDPLAGTEVMEHSEEVFEIPQLIEEEEPEEPVSEAAYETVIEIPAEQQEEARTSEEVVQEETLAEQEPPNMFVVDEQMLEAETEYIIEAEQNSSEVEHEEVEKSLCEVFEEEPAAKIEVPEGEPKKTEEDLIADLTDDVKMEPFADEDLAKKEETVERRRSKRRQSRKLSETKAPPVSSTDADIDAETIVKIEEEIEKLQIKTEETPTTSMVFFSHCKKYFFL